MSYSIESCSDNPVDNAGYQEDDTTYPLPDLTYLNEMADGDETFVKEMITHFLEIAPGSLGSLKESALSGDLDKLRFVAHTLLPQLTFVGILAAIPDISQIEEGSKQGDDLSVGIERAIKIINYGIEDLKKMI